MIEGVLNDPTLTALAFIGLPAVVCYFVAVLCGRKQRKRDEIKRVAEEEYQKWKKEHGL